MPHRLALILIMRGALLWALVRIVAFVSVLMARKVVGEELATGVAAPVLVTIALCMVDLIRRNERILLANLGLSVPQTVGVMLSPALVGELAYGALALH